MYRPTIKSRIWLVITAIMFIGLYYWVETSIETIETADVELKLQAAQLMADALEVLQTYRLPGVTNDNITEIIDPLRYTMLGEKYSPITTDEGRITDKITVLNPNFAAVMAGYLIELKLNKGDTIAVMLSGSMPGANIAALTAIHILNLHPVIITSVGASWWGANHPDFTWLDMERVLYDEGIFPFKSTAASTGGSDDQGGLRISSIGRQLIADAINRNEVIYISEGTLTENIKGRLRVFEITSKLANYKAVLNVGGGIAAIGHGQNRQLIPTGVSTSLPEKNYPNLGVIHYFSQENVPLIYISDISKIAREFKLPEGQLPLPAIGSGAVFTERRYNVKNAWIALIAMIIIMAAAKYFDKKHYQWREEKQDPDTML